METSQESPRFMLFCINLPFTLLQRVVGTMESMHSPHSRFFLRNAGIEKVEYKTCFGERFTQTIYFSRKLKIIFSSHFTGQPTTRKKHVYFEHLQYIVKNCHCSNQNLLRPLPGSAFYKTRKSPRSHGPVAFFVSELLRAIKDTQRSK